MKNKFKELSMRGWIATILMFGSIIMMYITYGKTDLCDTFCYFGFFGMLGVIFDNYDKDNPFIYIGPNRKKDKEN